MKGRCRSPLAEGREGARAEAGWIADYRSPSPEAEEGAEPEGPLAPEEEEVERDGQGRPRRLPQPAPNARRPVKANAEVKKGPR